MTGFGVSQPGIGRRQAKSLRGFHRGLFRLSSGAAQVGGFWPSLVQSSRAEVKRKASLYRPVRHKPPIGVATEAARPIGAGGVRSTAEGPAPARGLAALRPARVCQEASSPQARLNNFLCFQAPSRSTGSSSRWWVLRLGVSFQFPELDSRLHQT